MTNKRSFDDDSMNSDSITNQQIVEHKSPKLNNLVLKLAWATKTKLANNLYDLIACYHNIARVTEEKKDKMIEENYQLMKTFMNLPSLTYFTGSSMNQTNKRIKLLDPTDEIDDFGGLFAELPWHVRDTVVDNIIKNHHTLVYSAHINKQVRLDLIEENNRLLQTLGTLKIRQIKEIVIDDEEEIMVVNNLAEVPQNNGPYFGNNDQYSRLSMMSNFNRVPKAIENSLNEIEITFRINIDDLQEFNVPRVSESVFLKNIQWSLRAYPLMDDEIAYLALFIQSGAQGEEICCDTSIILKLINFKDSQLDVVRTLDRKFAKVSSRGFSKFHILSDLLNHEIGFVKDNEITIIAQVKVHKYNQSIEN